MFCGSGLTDVGLGILGCQHCRAAFIPSIRDGMQNMEHVLGTGGEIPEYTKEAISLANDVIAAGDIDNEDIYVEDDALVSATESGYLVEAWLYVRKT
jgi:hypothetical protein